MKKILLASLIGLSSTYSFADVTIISPEELQVVALNEQEIKQGFFKTKAEYKVNAGQPNQIYIRYSQLFDDVFSDEHQTVKSDIGILQTPSLQDGQTYRLALAQQPKTLDEAKEVAKKPTIILYNAQNQIVVQQTFEQTTKTWFANGVLTRTYDLTKEKIKNTLPNKEKNVITPSVQPQKNALIQQWQKANETEREVFLQWLKNQQ